jgi:hypothetical protein
LGFDKRLLHDEKAVTRNKIKIDLANLNGFAGMDFIFI